MGKLRLLGSPLCERMMHDDMAADRSRPFVSRAGLKLDHALSEFALNVTGRTCADFGCNIGGFTDCLLQRRAAKVYAIDTGYGTLAYSLRVDERVVVMERTNALHAMPPEPVDLVTIDLAWTPQRHAIPAALKWLRADPATATSMAAIVTLVKPHYELSEEEKRELLVDGALDPAEAERVLHRVMEQMPQWRAKPVRWTQSPLTGGKSGGKSRRAAPQSGVVGRGNVEYLVLARPLDD
jgi:23S rRNA (cytidine1920-2'-O)/16S rRNA (cytidine1409-2'-O)-methyltransferase